MRYSDSAILPIQVINVFNQINPVLMNAIITEKDVHVIPYVNELTILHKCTDVWKTARCDLMLITVCISIYTNNSALGFTV